MGRKITHKVQRKISKKIKRRSKGVKRPSANDVRDLSGADARFNKQNLLALFSHEASERIRWSDSAGCVQYCGADNKWVKTRGLVDQLAACFYPRWSYKRAAKRPLGTAPGCQQAPLVIPKADADVVAAMGRRHRKSGLLNGAAVDAQMTEAINDGRVTGALHPLTAAMLAARERWGWKSLVSQFPVVFPECRIGTCIDEIAMDPQCRLILVENKTGYRDYLDHSCAMMEGPLADVSDAPINQHFLQLGLPILALERHWGITVHEAYVVRADDGGVVAYPMPRWFHERKQAIYDYFVARCAA